MHMRQIRACFQGCMEPSNALSLVWTAGLCVWLLESREALQASDDRVLIWLGCVYPLQLGVYLLVYTTTSKPTELLRSTE